MGETVGALLEDYAAFGEWLAAHEGDVVGVTQDCVGCPLALWLNQVAGRVWRVTPSYCHEWAGLESWKLPAWARAFVEVVDQRYGWCGYVTGGMALLTLEEVVR